MRDNYDFSEGKRGAVVKTASRATTVVKNKLRPIHPGEVLKLEYMEPFSLSCDALANAIGISPACIDEIVSESHGNTAETALRLARYFGTDAQSWMNLQQHYDLENAEQTLEQELANILPVRNFIREEDLTIGEDVMVIKQDCDKYDCIGQIWKVKKMGDGKLKVSVCFDGDVYNFKRTDLVLA